MNNELILLTEDNATPELVKKAMNSTMGLHYETESKKVRALIAAETRATLQALRA